MRKFLDESNAVSAPSGDFGTNSVTRSKHELLILSVLENADRPLGEEEIYPLVKGRRQTKVLALRKLLENQEIIRTGKGARGDPFLYSVPRRDIANTNANASQNESFTSGRDSVTAEPRLDENDQFPQTESTPILEPPEICDGAIYKSYQLSNGKVLNLTKEEFDNVVDVFRMLAEERRRKERKEALNQSRKEK